MQEAIVTSATFNTSKEIIWKTITEVTEMQQWFFENIPAFEATIGFKTQFLVQNEDRKFTHVWEIIEVIPYKKISYNWHYLEYDGSSIVSFELDELNRLTRLKVTHKITKPFKGDIVEFKRESGVAGWKYFITNRLKNFLEKTPN